MEFAVMHAEHMLIDIVLSGGIYRRRPPMPRYYSTDRVTRLPVDRDMDYGKQKVNPRVATEGHA